MTESVNEIQYQVPEEKNAEEDLGECFINK